MTFQEIIAELKKPFPPELHKDRPLPGGKRWLYIPWQAIRDRLDDVYPEWSVHWSNPSYVGECCVILCTITIAGVSRQAPGNAPIEMLSSGGKDMSRGTPLERATADAFKNAAEAFGVGRYIDDQVFVASYLSKKGDMRGYKYAKENSEIEVGARGTKKESPSIKPNVAPNIPLPTKTISKEQVARLWAVARSELNLTDSDVRSVFAGFGLESTADIPQANYDKVIQALKDFASVSTKF